MRKFVFFSILLAFFAVQSGIFAQVNSGKAVVISKSQNSLSMAVLPKVSETNVKWEETFNTITQPSDWIVIDNDNSGSAWEFVQGVDYQSGDSVRPQSGLSFWFSNYNNANVKGKIDEWLISPQLPMVQAGDSLVFYAGAIDNGYDDSLKVLISTTDQNPTSFTEIAYFKVQGPIGSWNRYAFDLSSFAGSQIYFAVNYYIVDGGPTGTNSDNVWIDNFVLKSSVTQTAKVQVIHNSADILADSVDVYVNGALAIDDFKFRSATPFLDLPAGVTLNIGVAPGTSTSVTDTIKNFPVVLAAGEKYVVFANGLLTGGYAANPDGKNTAFTLFVKDMARESAVGSGVDLFVLHGSTDAPTVDVKVRELSSATIVDNASYGDITPYINAPAQNITLDLYLGDGSTYVTSFSAPLSGLEGGAAAVFASGFLAPADNQNGAAFGLFAALPNGTVVTLPSAGSPTSVENEKTIPTEFGLLQNYPNPFNPSTVINFNLPVESFVTLKVFNILGEQVAKLIQNRLSAGTQQVNFNAAGLNSGVYLYQLEAKGIDGKNFTSVKKMILTK